MRPKRIWQTTLALAATLLASSPVPLGAEVRIGSSNISVNGSDSHYNQFDVGPGGSLSTDMENSADVWIQNDLELGGTLYLPGWLAMQRDASAPSEDQVIYFADDGSLIDETIFWDDSRDSFSVSDAIYLPNLPFSEIEAASGLGLFAEFPRMTFVVDSDQDESISDQQHWFEWNNDSDATDNTVMRLLSRDGDVGHLEVAGEVTPNHSFDLAESFWESEPLEPGELVAIDPHRGDAVRRSSGPYDRRVIGVVSTRPAIVMGGGAFSVDSLRETWGDEVVAELERERSALEAAVYAESKGLRDELDRLYSEATYGDHLVRLWAERAPERVAPAESGDGGVEALVPGGPSEREIAEGYQWTLRDHKMKVGALVLQRFFDERFADVALAGRVPVKVDASFGAIEPGDPLTASPVPGVAMKATHSGPIIGTALETLLAGEGRVTALVHRGWYAGDVGGELVTLRRNNRQKTDEIAELRRANLALARRLESLEQVVHAAAPGAPAAEAVAAR